MAGAVRRLAELIPGDSAKRLRGLLAIWAGEATVEASEDGVGEILSLLFNLPRQEADGLDAVLGLEICGALAEHIDSLDAGTAEALFEAMNSIHNQLDDGRPATAIFRTWLGTWSVRGQRLCLTYDVSQTFRSVMYSEPNCEALKPLLITTLKDIVQGGHPIFSSGPFPMRGVLFSREGPLIETLCQEAPEAADLYSLLSVDGDYGDTIGAIGEHWYWTGEHVGANAVSFSDVIDRAQEKGDYALCDVLIGCWVLFCTLFHRVPLPDLVGLATRINALPVTYRSSTYAVLGLLRREATASEQIRRDMDALLSWLPLIGIAPPENVETFMLDLFSRPLWSTLSDKERSRLVKCEESFVLLRRLVPTERQPERFRLLIVDWAAVAELVLRRAYASVAVKLEYDPKRPLGDLAQDFRSIFKANSNSWAFEELPRMYAALNSLNVLKLLNEINKRGGKHLGGDEITWEDVVYVHAGLYWTLRALLDVATKPPIPAKH